MGEKLAASGEKPIGAMKLVALEAARLTEIEIKMRLVSI
jgi:hypothetical protein